jgi:protein SCO1
MKISIKRAVALLLSALMLASVANASAAAPAASATETGGAAALPSDSVYQLPVSLVDQNGQAFELAARRGQPMVISMFYTSCQFVCPMIIDAIKATNNKLTPEERARVSTLMVSFDPAHDDVPALKATANKRDLDPAHWTLARTDAASVRKLAATLGIQYRLLSNGEYNHSTVLILLDAQGRIIGRTNKTATADPAFVKLVRNAARAATE